MGRFSDLKSGPARFTAADAACWRELADAVEQAVAGAGEARLARVLKHAAAARVAGEIGPGNVCVRLTRLARRWLGETARGRRDLEPELAGLIPAVRVLVEVFDPAAPRPARERRDVDG